MDAENQAMKALWYWLYDRFGAVRARGRGSRFRGELRGELGGSGGSYCVPLRGRKRPGSAD